MGTGTSWGAEPKLLILVDGYLRHFGALRASIRAEYNISNYRSVGLLELAELVAWLPPGCAFWRAMGGPLAITTADETLRWIEYRLQSLYWQQTEDGSKGRNRPKPPERIPYSGEVVAEESHAVKQAAARRRRAAKQ